MMFSRDFVPVAFAIPYHRNIPMDKYIHLSFLRLSQLILPSIDMRIPCVYCLAVLYHMNTPTNNYLHLSSIHPSPVVHMFHMIL